LRRQLVARGLDKALFEEVTRQLKSKAMTVETGTLVDAKGDRVGQPSR
jgi:IS5 family transposase